MDNKDEFPTLKAILVGSVAGIVMATLIGHLLTSRTIRDLENQIDKQNEQIEELSVVMNDHFDRIDSELDELSDSVDNLSSELSKLEESISRLDESLDNSIAALGNPKVISTMDDIALANREGRLLPCNRCSGEVELVSFDTDTVSYILDTDFPYETRYFIYCHTCGKYYGNYGSKDECIESWNFCAGLDY